MKSNRTMRHDLKVGHTHTGDTRMTVRKADCCKNCKHVGTDYHFRDAVLCNKTNKYPMNIEVCDLFEMKEIEQ